VSRSLFWLFLAIDTVLSVAMIVRTAGSLLQEELIGSIIVRTPIVGVVLLGTYFSIRRMAAVAPRIDPYVWFAMGITAGYFFSFAVLAMLSGGSPWNREQFESAHTDGRIWLGVWGPYAAAFVVTSILYGARRLRGRRAPARSPLPAPPV
jgi:hypothetical protein